MVRSFALVALLLPATIFAQSPQEVLAPFLDEQVVAVVRVRADKIKDATLADLDRKLAPAELRDIDGRTSPVSIAREKLSEWTAAGGGDAYVVFSFDDLPRRPPFVVLEAGKKPDDLIAVVKRWNLPLQPNVKGNLIVLSHPETFARLKDAKASERADLVQALSAGPEDAVRVIVAPSAETRKVYRETLPPSPLPGMGTVTSAELFDGFRSLTAQANLSAEPALRFLLQAKSPADAEKIRDTIVRVAAVPGLLPPTADPKPKVLADQVEIVWGKDGDRLSKLISDVLQPGLRDAYHSAATAESVDDLKHIMLAMHNYHDRHKSFPPRAVLGKDGKPLLSWRVAILPHLGAEALYKEFKLDEPWDSEHNRKLIAKMPQVFASNLLPAGKVAAGVTPYVVPVGDGTCFGKPEPVAIKDITDGTSQTVGVVLAIPSAVEWTKPADWEVDFKNVARGWRREPVQPHDGLICAFCDGSVHRLPATLPEETIRRLILVADGDVVELPR